MTESLQSGKQAFAEPATAIELSAGAVDFDPSNQTRSAARLRERDQFWSKAGDIYMVALGAVFIVLYAIGIFRAFANELRSDVAGSGLVDAAFGVVSVDIALSAALAATLMMCLRLLAKLGPLGVDAAQGLWWLDLPVPRNPILVRVLRRRLALSALTGVLLYIPIGAIGSVGWGLVLGCVATGLLLTDVVLVAVVFQIVGKSGILRRIVPVAIAVTGVLFVVEIVLRFAGSSDGLSQVWNVLPSHWPVLAQQGNVLVVVMLAAAGLAGFWWVRTRVERISTHDLIASGAISGHASSALFFLNPGELASAVGTSHGAAPRTSTRGTSLLPRRMQRGPVTALVRAESLVTIRHVGTWSRLLTGLAIPAAVAFTSGGNSPIALLAGVVLGSCMAGTAAAEAARQANRLPSDGFPVPLGRGAARRTHSLVPMALLVPWGFALAGTLWLLGAPGPEILVLGAFTGVGLAAGGVRRAFQPAADWESTMVLATLGRASAPLIGRAVHGVDVMVVGLVPLAVGLFMTSIPTTMLAVAAMIATICWLVGTTPSAEPKRLR